VSGTTYSYGDKEWNYITEDINYLFNPITRDSNNEVIAGGDIQSIQTNVGLLNYATKESQDRLLKIERAVFGIDAPTIPGQTNADYLLYPYSNYKLTSYTQSLVDGGIIRIIKELFNNNILIDKLYSSEERFKDNLTISYFNDMYLEMYGNYETNTEWENNISGLQYDVNGKLHGVYIFLNKMKNWLYEQDDSLKSEFTLLSKRMIYEDGNFKLDLPYFKDGNIKGIVKDQSILEDGNNLFFPDVNTREINGEYSAFGFINNKISTAWSTHIVPIYFPNNITNNNRDKPLFKYISNDDVVNNLYNLNRWGKYKNKLVIDEIHSNDSLPDNVIQYRFNSSGLSFDISGQNGEAEDINTKFTAILENESSESALTNSHRYVVTYLGKWIKEIHYKQSSLTPSEWTQSKYYKETYTPENVVFPTLNSGTLPTLTGRTLPSLSYDSSGCVTNWNAGSLGTFNQGTLPSLNDGTYTKSTYSGSAYTPETYTKEIYYPEELTWDYIELWMVEDWERTDDNTGIKFKRWFTNTQPTQPYISGITYRPEIHDFKLYGAHIPENYDMLTKVRSQNHIVDQIHLALQDGPVIYPKKMNFTKVQAQYELYIDNVCLVYWKPLNIANNYIILVKKMELNSQTGQMVTYWDRVGYTNTNAFVFQFSSTDIEFKIIMDIFDSEEKTILDSDMYLLNEFIIAEIKILGDSDYTSDKRLLEDNPDFQYLS
jgi:hypothetical protein